MHALIYYMKYLLSLLVILSFARCELINPDEEIPAYIQIDKIDVGTNYASEGSNSSKITDAWVFVDNVLIGVYELPVSLPYLGDGNHNITIKAGILVNGISATRVTYPFYKGYKTTLSLNRASTTIITPVVTYVSDTISNFAWLEDFEVGNSLIFLSGDTNTVVDTTEVFEGNRSIAIFLDDNHLLYEGNSFDSYTFPDKDREIYLEINYKSNNPFDVGVIANGIAKNYKVTVNEKSYWNKIYIELSDLIASTSRDFLYTSLYKPERK